MQTFLPYESFALSARSLDRQRLGKQRVEVLQMLNALTDPTKGWRNHPCTQMWAGYERALAYYGMFVCHEWKSRGYKDTCAGKIESLVRVNGIDRVPLEMPWWLGNYEFHRSHRANLLRKNPEHYRPLFGANHPDDLPYWWPTENLP